MFRIDNATNTTPIPTPGAPGPNVDGFYTLNTIVTPDWMNAVQEEISYVVEQHGGTLSKTNRTQLEAAIEVQIGAFARMPTTDEKAALVGTGTPSASNVYVTADTIASSLSIANLLYLEEQQTSGTNGGTFSSGGEQKRVLTNKVIDNIASATLTSGVISLPAGTYYMEGRAPAYRVDNHRCKLRDTTGAADIGIGSMAYAPNSDLAMTDSFVVGLVVLGSTSNIELQHICTTSRTADGFGLAGSFGTEVYSSLKIWKVA